MKIVVAGLTAAGKTTLAHALEAVTGSRYLSATQLIAEYCEVPLSDVTPTFWARYGRMVEERARDGNLDAYVDNQLIAAAMSPGPIVFDSWYLPWLFRGMGLYRIWLESGVEQRVMKARLSFQSMGATPPELLTEFLREKDEGARARLAELAGVDLYADRAVFQLVVDADQFFLGTEPHLVEEGVRALTQHVLARAG